MLTTQADSAYLRAVKEVALDILRKGPGERIATSVEIQERINVGSGTVQKALRELVVNKAVKLRAKGHKGTSIDAYDPAALWHAANLHPIRLVLTPPGALEMTAIASEFRLQLSARHIPTEFDYVRGAHRRIESLTEELPKVAVISRGAAASLGIIDNDAYSIKDIGHHSYYWPNTIVILSSASATQMSGWRIALDSESHDHEFFTLQAFPHDQDFVYVDCTFPDVPLAILEGKADAGVWHQVATVIPPELAGLQKKSFDWLKSEADSIANAVFVWRSELTEIAAIINLLDLTQIRERQSEISVLSINSPAARELLHWL